MSEEVAPEAASKEIDRQASVYVFPGPGRQHYPGSAPTQPVTATLPDASSSVFTTVPSLSNAVAKGCSNEKSTEDEEVAARNRRRPCPRTHARSASHGGVLAECLGGMTNTGFQPHAGSYLGPLSAIGGSRPSALKKPGHQRAFSQGQVIDVQGHSVTGHSRVGSRTDFILPPGHRDDSRPPMAGKVPSFRGHSRQASRYVPTSRYLPDVLSSRSLSFTFPRPVGFFFRNSWYISSLYLAAYAGTVDAPRKNRLVGIILPVIQCCRTFVRK